MVVAAYDGDEVRCTGEPGGTVKVHGGISYREVSMTVTDHRGQTVQVFMQPDEALDVALYLQRSRRLVEKGSG